jgi:hypothetical protein
MSVILPLDQMTTEEKLQAMEALWTGLTQNPEELESPSWHEQVLKERDERLASGQERLIDWEIAKKQLREK